MLYDNPTYAFVMFPIQTVLENASCENFLSINVV